MVKMIVIVMVFAVMGSIGWLYKDHQRQTIEIEKLTRDAILQKEINKNKMKIQKFNIETSVKSKEIKKGLKYDKGSSVSIDSTRFYLN